jgi:hypothetical protein
MNSKLFLSSTALVLSSCVPMTTPLPTVLSSPSPEVAIKTETPAFFPTPSPTLFLIDPFRIPTPINTPHPVPTALNVGLDLGKDPSALHDARVEGFKNTLSFKIMISGIGFEVQGADRYMVDIEGILTNISNKPIVVRRTLSSGHTFNEDVNWDIFYNGKKLIPSICCYDSVPDLSSEDFVVLQPNQFQKYSLGFPLPPELPDEEGHKISLSNQKVQIKAEYFGFNVGYVDYKYERLPDERLPYVDMNAWVGFVESNTVECVFP